MPANSLPQILSVYRDLIRHHEIRATAQGNEVQADIIGNVCGDIIVRISPVSPGFSGNLLPELLPADTAFRIAYFDAIKLIRLKYRWLTALPRSLVWILSLGLATGLSGTDITGLTLALGTRQPMLILRALAPLAVAAGFSLGFARPVGFFLLRNLIGLFTRLTKLFRRIRKRTPE
jgi:hypothetical protein